jgi:hypothetical protein
MPRRSRAPRAVSAILAPMPAVTPHERQHLGMLEATDTVDRLYGAAHLIDPSHDPSLRSRASRVLADVLISGAVNDNPRQALWTGLGHLPHLSPTDLGRVAPWLLATAPAIFKFGWRSMFLPIVAEIAAVTPAPWDVALAEFVLDQRPERGEPASVLARLVTSENIMRVPAIREALVAGAAGHIVLARALVPALVPWPDALPALLTPWAELARMVARPVLQQTYRDLLQLVIAHQVRGIPSDLYLELASSPEEAVRALAVQLAPCVAARSAETP